MKSSQVNKMLWMQASKHLSARIILLTTLWKYNYRNQHLFRIPNYRSITSPIPVMQVALAVKVFHLSTSKTCLNVLWINLQYFHQLQNWVNYSRYYANWKGEFQWNVIIMQVVETCAVGTALTTVLSFNSSCAFKPNLTQPDVTT